VECGASYAACAAHNNLNDLCVFGRAQASSTALSPATRFPPAEPQSGSPKLDIDIRVNLVLTLVCLFCRAQASAAPAPAPATPLSKQFGAQGTFTPEFIIFFVVVVRVCILRKTQLTPHKLSQVILFLRAQAASTPSPAPATRFPPSEP